MAESARPATRRRRGRLGSRLIGLVLLVIVPLSALSVVNALYERETAAKTAYAVTTEIVSTGRGVIKDLVHQTDVLLAAIGRTTNATGESCPGDLDAALAAGSDYRNLYAVTSTGTVVCTATGAPLRTDVAQEEWFQRTSENNDVTVSAPVPGLTADVPVMIISRPEEATAEPADRQTTATTPSGVLAASLDPARLLDFTEEHELPPQSVVQILGADGRVLARTTDIDRYFGVQALLYPRLQGDEKGNLEGKDVDGVDRLYSYERFDVGGETLYVMAGITRDQAYADANRHLVWSIGILLALGVGMGVLALLAGRSSVVTPIEHLRSAMAGFRAGDVHRRAGDLGGPAEIVELGSAFDAMADEIQLRLEDQQRLLAQLEEASEAERQTIAAGIHDEVLQTLSAVGIRIQLLRRRADERQQAELDRAREMLDATAAQLRGLLFDLRPPDFDRIGLAATLRETLEVRLGDELDDWSVTGDPGPDVPDEARILLYRVAQQALANIREHAGAHRVDIRFATAGTVITMEVADDGQGFDVTRIESEARPGHIGLQVMSDRARAAGGEVTITSEDGRGTTVRVDIPFRPEGAGPGPGDEADDAAGAI